MSLAIAQYLERRLSGASCPQLVFLDDKRRPDMCPADGLRAAALVKSPPSRYWVLGVFGPGVSAARLLLEMRGR